MKELYTLGVRRSKKTNSYFIMLIFDINQDKKNMVLCKKGFRNWNDLKGTVLFNDQNSALKTIAFIVRSSKGRNLVDLKFNINAETGEIQIAGGKNEILDEIF